MFFKFTSYIALLFLFHSRALDGVNGLSTPLGTDQIQSCFTVVSWLYCPTAHLVDLKYRETENEHPIAIVRNVIGIQSGGNRIGDSGNGSGWDGDGVKQEGGNSRERF